MTQPCDRPMTSPLGLTFLRKNLWPSTGIDLWPLPWNWPSSGMNYDPALGSTSDLSPGVDLNSSRMTYDPALGLTSDLQALFLVRPSADFRPFSTNFRPLWDQYKSVKIMDLHNYKGVGLQERVEILLNQPKMASFSPTNALWEPSLDFLEPQCFEN